VQNSRTTVRSPISNRCFLAAEFKVLRQRGHTRALVNGALFADAGAFGDFVNLGSDVRAVVMTTSPSTMA
jgi:hypothetical protein